MPIRTQAIDDYVLFVHAMCQYFILKICIIIVKVVKPCAGLGYEQHQCASFVYHLCTMMNSAQLGYGWTH